MTNNVINSYRQKTNRCEAKLNEIRTRTSKRDSWRCQLEAGHTGDHVSHSGHRRWADATNGSIWNFKDQVHAPSLFEDV